MELEPESELELELEPESELELEPELKLELEPELERELEPELELELELMVKPRLRAPCALDGCWERRRRRRARPCSFRSGGSF